MQNWRYALAHEVRWVTLLSVQGSLVPLASLPLTTARVGAGTLVVFGDYQIAPIAVRSTAMGRWRLTPPGYGGRRLRAGRGVLRRCAATPHLPPSGAPVSLRVGRFAGLTRHRRVIQHRGPLKGKTNGDVLFNTANPQGEGFFRPGALLLALFIAFWRCRSGPSGTGETGHRRGLRRGRRSWGCPWCRRSWCRLWGSSNSRRRREPPSTWP